MKRTLLSMVLLMTVAAYSSAAGIAAPPGLKSILGQNEKEGVNWLSDLNTAHKQAVADNKPIMVVFGAEWCGYCKKLEKQTLSSPEMVRYINDNFVAVHLDLDKEKKIGEILEVQALPCTVVLSPNADLLGRISGYQTPVPFQKNLAAARELFQPSQAVIPTNSVVR